MDVSLIVEQMNGENYLIMNYKCGFRGQISLKRLQKKD